MLKLWFERFKRKGKRDEIFLATKFGFTGNADRPVNGDPEYVKESIAKSLSRLGGKCSRIVHCLWPI